MKYLVCAGAVLASISLSGCVNDPALMQMATQSTAMMGTNSLAAMGGGNASMNGLIAGLPTMEQTKKMSLTAEQQQKLATAERRKGAPLTEQERHMTVLEMTMGSQLNNLSPQQESLLAAQLENQLLGMNQSQATSLLGGLTGQSQQQTNSMLQQAFSGATSGMMGAQPAMVQPTAGGMGSVVASGLGQALGAAIQSGMMGGM